MKNGKVGMMEMKLNKNIIKILQKMSIIDIKKSKKENVYSCIEDLNRKYNNDRIKTTIHIEAVEDYGVIGKENYNFKIIIKERILNREFYPNVFSAKLISLPYCCGVALICDLFYTNSMLEEESSMKIVKHGIKMFEKLAKLSKYGAIQLSLTNNVLIKKIELLNYKLVNEFKNPNSNNQLLIFTKIL